MPPPGQEDRTAREPGGAPGSACYEAELPPLPSPRPTPFPPSSGEKEAPREGGGGGGPEAFWAVGVCVLVWGGGPAAGWGLHDRTGEDGRSRGQGEAGVWPRNDRLRRPRPAYSHCCSDSLVEAGVLTDLPHDSSLMIITPS